MIKYIQDIELIVITSDSSSATGYTFLIFLELFVLFIDDDN